MKFEDMEETAVSLPEESVSKRVCGVRSCGCRDLVDQEKDEFACPVTDCVYHHAPFSTAVLLKEHLYAKHDHMIVKFKDCCVDRMKLWRCSPQTGCGRIAVFARKHKCRSASDQTAAPTNATASSAKLKVGYDSEPRS